MKTIYLYAHTHWDREWYQPFESMRSQLKAVFKKSLQWLADGSLPCFFLDGQTVIIEDLLDLDSRLGSEVEAVLRSGRMAVGPWYVLADQCLVSGESLIRNLALGLYQMRELGLSTAECTGYAPDTFGHSGDLPQILSGFGIDTAIVWRGVPSLCENPVFWWCSADGSRVLTYHLRDGYFQTLFHDYQIQKLSDPDRAFSKLVAQVEGQFLPKVEAHKSPGDNASNTLNFGLLPVGCDHTLPARDLGETVGALNDHFTHAGIGLQLKIVQLSDFSQAMKLGLSTTSYSKFGPGKFAQPIMDQEIPLICGELRDNSSAAEYQRAFLLDGVLSTRLYLKRANRRLEHFLHRYAEPLLSQLSLLGLLHFPEAEFDYANKLLLKNQPHDSICGCSVDSVHREMITRYARAEQCIEPFFDLAKMGLLAEDCISAGLHHFDPAQNPTKLVVANSSSSFHIGPIPIKFATEKGEFPKFPANSFQLKESRRNDELFAGWGALPYYKEVDLHEGWLWQSPLPPNSTSIFDWPLAGQETGSSSPPFAVACQNGLENGFLKVVVESDGSLTVTMEGDNGNLNSYRLTHRLRDIGDCGDTYNFDPIPEDKAIFAVFKGVQPGRKGPLSASLILLYDLEIPWHALPTGDYADEKCELALFKRSRETKSHSIEVELILDRGSQILKFETTFENHSSDHRLEVVFETDEIIHSSFSEGHTSVVRRQHGEQAPLSIPMAMGEEAIPNRFPCQRFFIAGGHIFLNRGLPEYGIEGRSICFTILRAVGMLSRARLLSRGGGAGPKISVPEAQCLGRIEASYAWSPKGGSSNIGSLQNDLNPETVLRAFELVAQYESNPFVAFSSKKAEDLLKNPDLAKSLGLSIVEISEPKVAVTAMYMENGGQKIVIRLHNQSNASTVAHVRLNFAFVRALWARLDGTAGLEDLDCRPYKEFSVTFGPWFLKTLVIELRQDDADGRPAKKQNLKLVGDKVSQRNSSQNERSYGRRRSSG